MASSSLSLFSKNHPRRAAALQQQTQQPQQSQSHAAVSASQQRTTALSANASKITTNNTAKGKPPPPQLELVSQQQQHHRHHHSHHSRQREYLAPSPSVANATVVAPTPSSSALWPEDDGGRAAALLHYQQQQELLLAKKKKKRTSLHKMMGGGGSTAAASLALPEDTRSSASTTAVTQQRQEHQRSLLSKVLHQSRAHSNATGTARSATSAGATSLFSNPDEQRAFLNRLLLTDAFQQDMNPSSQATTHSNHTHHHHHHENNNNASDHDTTTVSHDDQKKKLRLKLQQKLKDKKEANLAMIGTTSQPHDVTTVTKSTSPTSSNGSSSSMVSITDKAMAAVNNSNSIIPSTTMSIDIGSAQKRIQKKEKLLRQDSSSVTAESSHPSSRLPQPTDATTAVTSTRQMPVVTTVTSTSSSDMSDVHLMMTKKKNNMKRAQQQSTASSHHLEMVVASQPPPSILLQRDVTSKLSISQDRLPTLPESEAAPVAIQSSTDTVHDMERQHQHSTTRSHSSHSSTSTSQERSRRLATEEPLDPGFVEFIHSLQKEVSNDHSELWNSFQGVFMGRDDDDDKTRRCSRTKSSTRHKLDTKAKEWLTSMNLHLKRSSVVECVKEAQLVNDKRVAKEMAVAAATTPTTSASAQTLSSRPVLAEVQEHQDTSSRIPLSSELPVRPHDVPDNKENRQDIVTVVEDEGDDLSRSRYGSSTKEPRKDEASTTTLVEQPQTVDDDDDESLTATMQAMAKPSSVVISPRGVPPDLTRVACESTTTSTVVSQSPDATLDARSSNGSNKSDDTMMSLQQWKQQQQPLPLPLPRQADAFALAQFAKKQVDRLHSLLDQHQLHEQQLQPISENALPIVQLNKTPTKTPSNPIRKESPSKTTVLTLRMALNKQKASLAGTKRRLLVDTAGGTLAHPPPPNPSWSEVKLKRPSSALDNVEASEATTATNIPWQSVKLRSVTKKEATNTLTPPRPASRWISKSLADTEDEDDDDEHDLMNRTDSDIEMTDRSTSAKVLFQDVPLLQPSESASSVLSVPYIKQPPPLPFNFPSSSSEQEAPNFSTENNGIDEDGMGIGQTVDLERLPEMLTNAKGAKPFILSLAPNDSDAATVVVVGNGILMTLHPLANSSSEHQIVWRSSRAGVQTVALDLASKRVDITLSNANPGAKSLFFKSAEDCLKFAKSFYTVQGSDFDGNGAGFVPETTSTDATVTNQLDSSHTMTESLSEEEQKVLEMYRRMRLTKGKDDAMQETIKEVVVSPPPRFLTKTLSSPSFEPPKHIPLPPPISNTELVNILRERRAKQGGRAEALSNTLDQQPAFNSSAESTETVAEKYLKMLKVSIPLEAVLHKMKQDEVSEDIQRGVVTQWEKLSLEKAKGNASSKSSETRLSNEEENIADRYRKMLQMRVPHEAVRHKMTRDNVDPRIIMVVLDVKTDPESNNDESNATKQSGVSDEDEAIASVYRKMLKMMIPAEAVRHRMVKDQVDERILTLVLGEKSDSRVKGLTNDEEKVAEVYRKMLKLMVPADAVRHRMTKDQVDEKIVLVVLGSNASSAPNSGKLAKQVLSEEEEAIAETYRKMLKLQIPKEAVRHRMKKEEVSARIVAAVLGESGDASDAKGAPPGTKLVSLHWTPLSGDELDKSIWRASKKRKVTPAKPEGKDISKLIQLFQKKDNAKSAKTATNARDPGHGDKAKLIDLNRANNVAISLKAFKDFTHVELSEVISHLDPLKKIGTERVHFIKDLLPTTAEAKAVREYDGPDNKLVAAELWFRQIVTVQRVEAKVQVMRTMETFETDTSAIIRSFRTLGNVCQQVMASEKLQDLLEMILQIGNIMNEGTRTGGAAGFKFDSLLKLTQTKSSDGTTTVLDYLVTIFVAKGQRETLLLSADFPECQTASRVNISDLLADARSLESAVNACRTELDSIRKEDNAQRVEEFMKRKPLTDTHDTKSEAAAGAGIFGGNSTTGSNALLDSIRTQNMAHETQSEAIVMNPNTLKQREKFLAALRAKKEEVRSRTDEGFGSPLSKQLSRGGLQEESQKDVNEGETKQNTRPPTKVPVKSSRQDGVKRLEKFISAAEKTLASVNIERDEAIQSCANLSTYCGESGGERATTSLLGVLSEFAVLLDQAVKKHDEKVEAESRRAAFEKKRQVHSPRKKDLPPTSKRKSRKSLVIAVNELLKEASDQTKDDFTKGVVYHNPDKKLQEIYELERQTVTFVPPPIKPAGIPQEDILSAIKKRRHRSEMLRLQHSVSSSAVSSASSSAASSDLFAATSSAITEVTSNLTNIRGDEFLTPVKAPPTTPLRVHIRQVETGSGGKQHTSVPLAGQDHAKEPSYLVSGMSTPKQPEGIMCCIYR